MLDAGLVVTVNSDDPSYIGGYLNKNFTEIANSVSLGLDEVIKLAENSFTASFLPEREIQEHLEAIGHVRDRRRWPYIPKYRKTNNICRTADNRTLGFIPAR
jgi:adenosine deaminase